MSPDPKLARVLQVYPVKVPMCCHIATRAHVVVEITVCIDGEVGSVSLESGRQLKLPTERLGVELVLHGGQETALEYMVIP